MDKSKKEFLNKKQLKERGWTESMIKKFLAKPDAEKQNPKYRSAASMKLYKLERVQQVESSSEYQQQSKQTASRKQAAQKAVTTKLMKTWEYLDTVDFQVPMISKNQLIQDACNHYNNNQYDRDRSEYATAGKDSEQTFLDRITVNYLRHCMSDYEYEINKITGKVGKDEGYLEIKRKILDAIAEQYTWLEKECNKQLKDAENRIYLKVLL